MIESAYTKAIHKKLQNNIKAWKINDNYAGGVPDALYRDLDGCLPHVWVEYKLIKTLPVRGATSILPNLSKLQLQWLMQARAANECACVIVGCQNEKSENGGALGVILTDPTLWTEGFNRDYFKANALDYQGIADAISSGRVSNAQGVRRAA